ncbi:MAG TPA: phenylalanine--tRNA ligase subunit beta [Vicinamibacteria bacterium]
MRVPLSWLKEFADLPADTRRLVDDLTMVGFPLESMETRGDDVVLDLDVTTNRVDCMNVYGIAREVAAIYGKALRPIDVRLFESGPPAAQSLEVTVAAPDLCPRFCARVLDVSIGPSPAWIRERLEAVGVRPINNVVDLTNYVMMEMGQPSHAFDLERIPEHRLRVRWAREGERLTTLDGLERTLSPRIGVVAGPDAPLALAGIMGGASSEVSDETRVVALEAAYWEPVTIRRAAKALGMRTEASHRFERGADPNGTVVATARIGHLLQKIGAGSMRPGLIDQHPAPRPRRQVFLHSARLSALLGTEVKDDRAREILTRLGFAANDRQATGIPFDVPSWRTDVTREVDLVEEVGRHHGLDKVPATLPPATRREGLRPWQARARALRELLVGAGLVEVINYAFVPRADAGRGAVLLANPISEEQSALRTSLVPSLLANLRANRRRGARDVRLFEVGRVFASPNGGAPTESLRLGLLLAGAAAEAHWSDRARPVDFFDLKGVLEALAARLTVDAMEFAVDGALPEFVHPGKAAAVRIRGRQAGYIGALHPDAAEGLELRDEVLVGELDLEPVLKAQPPAVRVRPLPRFPAVTRDLSLFCEIGVAAEELAAIARRAAGELLQSVTVVDRYEGAQVPAGKVSLSLQLVYQDPSRTLTGSEVQQSVDAVAGALREHGAEIRA